MSRTRSNTAKMSYTNTLLTEYEPVVEEMSGWSDSLGKTIDEMEEIAGSEGMNPSDTELRDVLVAFDAASDRVSIERRSPRFFDVRIQ